MQDLFVKTLFSLEDFAHRELFEDVHFAWEVLNQLINYLEAQKLGKIETEVPSSVHLVNPSLISIGKGTRIEPGCYIQGPCIIGPDNTICHGAYIRGNVITGKGCTIGHDSEVKHSIFLNGAKAAHFNYVGDSILGNDVNLGAGVKCANLRFDHALVTVYFQNKKIATNLKKLGAIIGDKAQVGCNSVTNPGTIIGKSAFCYPCLNIAGCIPTNAKVKPSHQCIIEE